VLSLIHTLSSSLQHVLSLLSLLCLHQLLSGNGFQQQPLPLLWVPELPPWLSYRLLTTTDHNDWTAAILWLLTNQLTSLCCTQLHCTHWIERGWSRDMASEQTTQKTPLPTVLPLLHTGRWLATAKVSLFVSRLLPSNGSICHSMVYWNETLRHMVKET
jgi:hypothetical protein